MPTSSNWFSERVPVTHFNFAMNVAEVAARGSRSVWFSANLAWCVAALWVACVTMPLKSFIVLFAKAMPPGNGLAPINFARPRSPFFWKYMPALVMPFHVAGRTKGHQVLRLIVPPIAINMVNFEAPFCSASTAFFFKKYLSRVMRKSFSVAILLVCEPFVPLIHFHGQRLPPEARFV